jgi:hypothetical protein
VGLSSHTLVTSTSPPFKTNEEDEFCFDSALDDDTFLLDDPPCETILSHLWEDENDIEALDDPFFSLDDNSICGDSFGNYVVEFASNAYNYYEMERSKSPLYVTTLFIMQALVHDILCLPQTCCFFFMYKMPIHIKRVRLKSYFLNALWCAPCAFK